MTNAPRLLANIFGYLISLVWRCVRLPLLVFLVILEPVVRFVVGPLALLGLLMAFFWWSIGVPHFHFALMLGMSLGLGSTLLAYHALLRAVSKYPTSRGHMAVQKQPGLRGEASHRPRHGQIDAPRRQRYSRASETRRKLKAARRAPVSF